MHDRQFDRPGGPASLCDLLALPGVREDVALRSRFGFMAIHGGDLELMTDTIAGVAADDAGHAYVTSSISSPDYVSTVVLRMNTAGSHFDYYTRIRGDETGGVFPSAIAVDPAGAAYVTGYTGAPTFPTTR